MIVTIKTKENEWSRTYQTIPLLDKDGTLTEDGIIEFLKGIIKTIEHFGLGPEKHLKTNCGGTFFGEQDKGLGGIERYWLGADRK